MAGMIQELLDTNPKLSEALNKLKLICQRQTGSDYGWIEGNRKFTWDYIKTRNNPNNVTEGYLIFEVLETIEEPGSKTARRKTGEFKISFEGEFSRLPEGLKEAAL